MTKVLVIAKRKESKMNKFAIAQRTKTGSFIRTDLRVFDLQQKGYDYIALELFDWDFKMFYITPLEAN